MKFEIPTVETARLVLRGFRDDDLDAFAAMSADLRGSPVEVYMHDHPAG